MTSYYLLYNDVVIAGDIFIRYLPNLSYLGTQVAFK